MTRAEDHLILCGWSPRQTALSEDSWYGLAQRALKKIGSAVPEKMLCEKDPQTESQTQSWVYGDPLPNMFEKNQKTLEASELMQNPDRGPTWLNHYGLRGRTSGDLDPQKVLTREGVDLSSPPSLAAFLEETPEENLSIERGVLGHLLFEKLIPLSGEDRRHCGEKILAQSPLPDSEKQILYKKVMSILETPAYTSFFSGQIFSEIPLTGILEGQPVSGRLDLLVVQKDKVCIVDFKTDHRVPKHRENIPQNYQKQMSLYQTLVQKIYPEKLIEAYLLWVEDGSLMQVDSDL